MGLLVDLGAGKNRLGASCLAQVYNQLGKTPVDLDAPELLLNFFNAVQALLADNKLLAYHDRSDGGLFVSVAEMAFAGKTGVSVALDSLGDDDLAALYSEELGAVLQVSADDVESVLAVFAANGLGEMVHNVGTLNTTDTIEFTRGAKLCLAKRELPTEPCGPKPRTLCSAYGITR